MALDGLNYGKVHDPETDGEIWLIKKLYTEFSTIRETIIIFDVGANRGDYTRNLMGIFGDRPYQVHLFEPGSSAFEQLRTGFSNKKLVINHFGFGESSGKTILYIPGSETNMASIHHRLDNAEEEEVELVSMDDYCMKNNISFIHLLKLDVEGHEFACLKGARKMLKNHKISNIQFEFGISNIYSRVFFKDIYDLLNDSDYDIYRLVKNGLVPIKMYHHSLEIFYTTNYFACTRKK